VRHGYRTRRHCGFPASTNLPNSVSSGPLSSRFGPCWRGDRPLILGYDLRILGNILLVEQSTLEAYALLRKKWGRALSWLQGIWRRVRALAEERLGWFD
jgi:hypothetical protein